MRDIIFKCNEELYQAIIDCRFKEKRNSMSEFIRTSLTTYLENNGYEFAQKFADEDRRGKPPLEEMSLAQAIETYVAPKESTEAWGEIPKWGE